MIHLFLFIFLIQSINIINDNCMKNMNLLEKTRKLYT